MTVIVIDPQRGPAEDNLRGINLEGERCPHFREGRPGNCSCAIHHYPWFADTPCGQHGQIEKYNSPCRMGEWVLRELSISGNRASQEGTAPG